jgi:glycosyltransferase involved in cell wall biosynthesis
MDLVRVTELALAAPAYNEAEGIEGVIGEWVGYLDRHPAIASYEIVVCNDGSADATGAILERLAAANPNIKPVQFARNQGAAAALGAAIAATTKAWVALIDSDGQFPVRNLDRMIAAVEASGSPAAIGVRAKQDSAFARYGSLASGFAANLAHGSRYKDFNSAFKLVDGPLLRSLDLEARGLNYSTEVTSKLLERGVSLVEVPIEHLPRTTGRSSLRRVRGAIERLLFVFYIAVRQLMLRAGVLRAKPGK